MISANVAAPEMTLTDVKLAASMSCCPNASRQSNELAANAIIAMTVSVAVLVAIELNRHRRASFMLRKVKITKERQYHVGLGTRMGDGRPRARTLVTPLRFDGIGQTGPSIHLDELLVNSDYDYSTDSVLTNMREQ